MIPTVVDSAVAALCPHFPSIVATAKQHFKSIIETHQLILPISSIFLGIKNIQNPDEKRNTNW